MAQCNNKCNKARQETAAWVIHIARTSLDVGDHDAVMKQAFNSKVHLSE